MNKSERVWAVIPAAGSGSRMGGLTSKVSKVFLTLGPCSIIGLALRSMLDAEVCTGVIVLGRESETDELRELLTREGAGFEWEVALGGATRQESVYRGLDWLRGRADYVLIHDGARPFCPPSVVCAVLEAARKEGAALPVLPVKPSMKIVSNGRVESTVPRSSVFEAQTPQAFRYELVLEAYELARKEGFTATDDSELIERLGCSVAAVPGDERNIKITSALDLEIAERILHTSADN